MYNIQLVNLDTVREVRIEKREKDQIQINFRV